MVQRLTISVDDEHAQALRRVAHDHGTNVSAVVRAAAEALTADAAARRAIRRRIEPDRRGGARPGAGRKGSRTTPQLPDADTA